MGKFKRGDTAIIVMPPEKLKHPDLWGCKMVVIRTTYEEDRGMPKVHRVGLRKGECLCDIINLSDYKIFKESDLEKCDLFRQPVKGEENT